MKDSTQSNNPFPGLRPFQYSERNLFFGRERQSQELLRKLRRNRFLAVVGTSGSGKSSLVRAGLLPELEKGFVADAGPRWRIALFRPGTNPIHNLAQALNSPETFAEGDSSGPATPSDQVDTQLKVAVIETTLRRSALGLAEYAKRCAQGEPENLLVCVDQFEELFRFKEQSQMSNPEDDAAGFVKLLLEAARYKGGAVYVLLTMRSDFLGECSQFRDLPEAINEGQYLIPRMTRDEQREAITEPAASRKVEMTARLVQRLLNDVGDNPDHLPLLQHALMRTWDHWVDENGAGTIDLDHYKAVGGMEKALSNHAQQTFDALTDELSRKITEKLFKALTETVVNNKEIRRPAELSEICGIAEAEPAQVIKVIDHFRSTGRSFLMPPLGTELAADTIIDISHESLIKGWDLLKKWVEEEAKSKAMYQRVADAADRRYQAEGGLWRDPDLKFALEWQQRQKPNEVWAQRYNPQFKEAMAFLKESKDEQARYLEEKEARVREERERKEREQQRELALAQATAITQQEIADVERRRAEEAQRREEAERERAKQAQLRERAEYARAEAEGQRAVEKERSARRLKFAVGALVAMFLLASVAAGYAYNQRNQALAHKDRADQNALRLKEELTNSEKLSSDREEARKEAEHATVQAIIEEENAVKAQEDAQAAEADAESQKALALTRADDLQTALDKLKSAQESEKLALEREKLEKQGLVSLEKEETATAVLTFNNLMRVYKNDPSIDGQIAWSWASYNLGTASRQGKSYELAAKSYNDALEKQKAIYGEQDLQLAPAFKKLAQVFHDQGDYSSSVTKYEELLKILERPGNVLGTDRITGVKSEMAELFHDQARDEQAGARAKEKELGAQQFKRYELQESLRLSGESSSVLQKDLAAARQDEVKLISEIEALKKSSAEKYALAEKLYKVVLENKEQFLPQIDPDLLKAYSALAAFYQDWAELFGSEKQAAFTTQSKQLYELARLVREEKVDPKVTGAAKAKQMETLASSYIRLERYEPAEGLLKKVLAIRKEIEATETPSHPNHVRGVSQMSTLQQLVVSLYSQGREAEARGHFEDLLKIVEGVSLAPSSVTSLVSFFDKKQKYVEAEELLDLLLKIRKKSLRDEKDDRSKKLLTYRLSFDEARLGDFRIRQQKYAAAEESLRESLRLLKTEFGPASELEYFPSGMLGDLYLKQGRFDEALTFFNRVQEVLGKKIGPVQRATWQRGESGLRVEIVKSYFRVVDPAEYTNALSALAKIHEKRHDYLSADASYKELVALSEWISQHHMEMRYFGPRDEEASKKAQEGHDRKFADALEAYAAFLKKPEVGRAAEAKQLEDRAAEIREELEP